MGGGIGMITIMILIAVAYTSWIEATLNKAFNDPNWMKME